MSLPPLTWDEDSCHWAGPVEVPWYRPMPSTAPAGVRWHSTTEPTELVVLPADSNTEGDAEAHLTPAQLAAYTRTVPGGADLRGAILGQFRDRVPELASATWADLEAFFRLAEVRLFPAEQDGLGYVGLVFGCLRQWEFGYEHGAGIVLHGDRVIRFGVAEMANDEAAALADKKRRRRQ